jgi:hypothetical protein
MLGFFEFEFSFEKILVPNAKRVKKGNEIGDFKMTAGSKTKAIGKF